MPSTSEMQQASKPSNAQMINDYETNYDHNRSLFTLLDKYLKSNDNFLPLQAYLKYVESESVAELYTICHKSTSHKKPDGDTSNLPTSTATSSSVSASATRLDHTSASTVSTKTSESASQPALNGNTSNGNSKTTLGLFEVPSTNVTSVETSPPSLLFVQKLYKVIVSIDYSHQTSIEFIRTSLERIFAKLAAEYDDVYEASGRLFEPKVYVTCILWNTAYFQYVLLHNMQQQQQRTANGNAIDPPSSQTRPLPFAIICHSKRMLKCNMQHMAAHIFDKINAIRHVFAVESSKLSVDSLPQQYHYTEQHQQQQRQRRPAQGRSPFEDLLAIITRLFGLSDLDGQAAPTSMALAHHIHVTDGLVYSRDTIRCLAHVAKSAASFSFIYSGSSSFASGKNISSCFGFIADHYFMKLLARLTAGFYAVVDENMRFSLISNNRLLLLVSVQSNQASTLAILPHRNNSNMTQVTGDDEQQQQQQQQRQWIASTQICGGCNYSHSYHQRHHSVSAVTPAPTDLAKFTTNITIASPTPALPSSSSSSSSNLGSIQRPLRRVTPTTATTMSNGEPSDPLIERILASDAIGVGQPMDVRRLCHYELLHKHRTLQQLVRLRIHEGFYLMHVLKRPWSGSTAAAASSSSSSSS